MKATAPKKERFTGLLSSFDNHSTGLSGRKLTAFAGVSSGVSSQLVWLIYAFKSGDFDLLTEIVIIDFSLALLCLGIITFQEILKFKNGNSNSPETPEKKEEVTEVN